MNTRRLLLAVTLGLSARAGIAGVNHDQHGHPSINESAIGVPGDAARVKRTIEIVMTDQMRFNPSNITVKQGVTVRFKVKNSGRLKHEFVLGTDKEIEDHDRMMLENPGMAHNDRKMVTLSGGQTGEVIWQFTKSGKVAFACLQPGHYASGMKGAVNVIGDSESTPILVPGSERARQP